jgi:hypothetical protein
VDGGDTTKRRTTVAEAAELLGISAEAVRGRIRRGTLPVEREGGTVYVLLDAPAGYRTTGDRSRTTVDQPTDRTDLLIAELQDRVRSLEEANRENRRIIAALTQRIPEIEAPREHEATPEPREAPVTATEQPGRVGPQPPLASPEMPADEQQGRGPIPDTGGSQEAPERPQERRGFWSRVFGA